MSSWMIFIKEIVHFWHKKQVTDHPTDRRTDGRTDGRTQSYVEMGGPWTHLKNRNRFVSRFESAFIDGSPGPVLTRADILGSVTNE